MPRTSAREFHPIRWVGTEYVFRVSARLDARDLEKLVHTKLVHTKLVPQCFELGKTVGESRQERERGRERRRRHHTGQVSIETRLHPRGKGGPRRLSNLT